MQHLKFGEFSEVLLIDQSLTGCWCAY